MIRQAVSCDICGTEKKQTNHWFVARESSGELHLGGWNSRNRSRAGSKHLCGQTCLHKMVDEFMARSISARTAAPAEQAIVGAQAATADTSLTSAAAFTEPASSPRLVQVPEPLLPARVVAPVAASTASAQLPMQIESAVAVMTDEPPAYSARSWRAEAWERERERELRSVERRPDVAARRRAKA